MLCACIDFGPASLAAWHWHDEGSHKHTGTQIAQRACAGQEYSPPVTQHTAPEAASATLRQRTIAAKRSQDIFALGSLAYATITHAELSASESDIAERAQGKQQYPWEAPPEQQPPAWRETRLAALLLPCLARDPSRRPGAAAVLAAVSHLVNSG